MSTNHVEDAVKFSIEDIKESLGSYALDDEEYIKVLYDIVHWCTNEAIRVGEEVRNAGGRG